MTLNGVESKRVAGFSTSVFSEFSALAAQYGAVNLGQGFPDFDGPQEVKAAAVEAIASGLNQYAPSSGLKALRVAVSAHAMRFYGQRLDPDSQVVVTSGATEALFDAAMAFLDPGDEAVLFEPAYDSYEAAVRMAGATARFVCLEPPDSCHSAWWFREADLERAFTERTRLVFLNTPHNPTGKVFTKDELLLIGELAKRSGAVVLSDEVYEHLVYSPARHLRPATLPILADRTLTISSGGKSFSFTGWKIGWAAGPAPLAQAIVRAHQWITFASASPFQAAMAVALELPDSYFSQFVEGYRAKRDFLSQALKQAGFETLACEGSYFLMARTDSHRRFDEYDVAFCRRLVKENRIAAIPPSAFYSQASAPKAFGLARFAFCKSEAVLQAAAERLGAMRRACIP